MASVYLAPFYLALNGYLLWRLLQCLGLCTPFFTKKWGKILVCVPFLLLVLSPVFAFLLPGGTPLRRIMEKISNGFLAVLLYAVLIAAATELVAFLLRVLRRRKKWNSPWLSGKKGRLLAGAICACATLLVSLYGGINASILHTTPYDITVKKDGGPLQQVKIVLVADLHLGYTVGTTAMEQMVEKINAQAPDLVVLAGDLFDNDYEAMKDPQALISILKAIQSKYGVYACYGNHDVAEKILVGFTFDGKEKQESDPRMDVFLEQAGIQLLQDEAVLIADSFTLYGRPDYSRPGRGITVRKTPSQLTADLDLEKPLVVLDHAPKELDALADAGVDVDLSGHTHAGQVFPGNIIIQLFAENGYGYQLRDEMHSIVTSGVGLFGPNSRTATIAEICPITIHFSPPTQ